MPLTVLITVIVHLFNMCHSVDLWNLLSLELLVPLSSIIKGESRQAVSGGMKTPSLKNYMPDVKLCRSQPFSGAIADTSRQEGRLTCPSWDPRKKTVSSPSFKCFPLSSSRKYLSFAFVPNLFRWTPRSGGRISSAYDISRPKAT